MTKTYYINDKGFDDDIKDFIAFMNENFGIEKIIFLNSGGGLTTNLHIYLTLINGSEDKITLIACDFIGSCALDLFLYSECEKIVEDRTTGLFHHKGREFMFRGGKLYYEADRMSFDELADDGEKEWQKLLNFGLTEKEEAEYEKCQLITFSTQRLRELVKIA